MLKLCHLFNNPALAQMLLENWEHDDSSSELFQYFRISANAIYPFRQDGEICFLRCCPTCEKLKENIRAELSFIIYLRGRGYPALEPLPAKGGELLVQKMTPWGEHYASAFRRVPGKPVDETDMADEVIYAYGMALGWLHLLSSQFTPTQAKHWTYVQVFDWIETTLHALPSTSLPLDECRLLRTAFAALPMHAENYGLIHYDFEPDNVFYDAETKSVSVIDFDDAMYHWYVMDIVQALYCLKSHLPEQDHLRTQAVFLKGYGSRYVLDESLLAAASLFRRFANLYRYTRTTLSVQEQWEHEPAWMGGLRLKLSEACRKDAEYFGNPVNL